MASRPVFIPKQEGSDFVLEKVVNFEWFPGFSLRQKQRSIESLHGAIEAQYDLAPLLEISSKSTRQIGISLSAFNLFLELPALAHRTSVESAFQGSKVFENDGPFTDLYKESARKTKKDARLQTSGELQYFQLGDERWLLEPKTSFYDWLYLNALRQHPVHAGRLLEFKGFTDIEFNPRRSINCQARSAALYVSLDKRDLWAEALQSKEAYLRLIS